MVPIATPFVYARYILAGYTKMRRSIAFNANYQVFTRSEEMVNGKPVVEWVGGNTTAVQHQYTYWDKTKIKGETK